VKVIYAPAGADPKEWTWDPDDVFQSQAELIQKRYGGNWEDFTSGVRNGDARARKVLLWHFLRLVHPTMRYEDTPDFRMRELKVEYDVDELIRIRDRILKADLTGEERDAALASVEFEISERIGEVPDPEPAVEPGKASSASG
jgi:hypothetical protein